ncbi:hypothetical protein LAZ67_2005389 [Cordylochernes scorpioides]|uniref:Uncharacterized protein n=1 Tax=Cordylochernes scorpioides TaxID=51811 RepID=A0ABY6K5B1_9ARAC|nr:hypothetical protein LAZ67_2005389 [Cordylochernes scorpioides]
MELGIALANRAVVHRPFSYTDSQAILPLNINVLGDVTISMYHARSTFGGKLKFVCLLKMTTELPQIQKFNGDNFHLWKFQMKIILEAKYLLSITDGSEVKPEIEDIAKFSE